MDYLHLAENRCFGVVLYVLLCTVQIFCDAMTKNGLFKADTCNKIKKSHM